MFELPNTQSIFGGFGRQARSWVCSFWSCWSKMA